MIRVYQTQEHAEQGGILPTWLMVIISALLCLGALMVFSAGASLDQQIDPKHFWRYATLRRVAFVPVVWVVLALVGNLDYHRLLVSEKSFWLSPIVWLLVLSVVLLGLVLIPGIGAEINYSRRWLKIGPTNYGLTFQPSELGKWSVVLFLAVYSHFVGQNMSNFRKGFLPACAVLLLVVGLIGKEDFGTAALVGVVGAAVMLIAGVRRQHLLVLTPVAAGAFYLLVYCNAHRWNRVLAYLYADTPGTDFAGAYHARQSIMALGAGGMWGCGLGKGAIKLGWLPEDTTDFVFAVIGEELGFVGCSMIIGLFIAFIIVSMLIIRRAPDRLGALLATAVALTIGLQAAMNLAVVTGLVPTKGIALPFVSAGGSGLLVTAVATGILLNIARQGLKRRKIPDS